MDEGEAALEVVGVALCRRLDGDDDEERTELKTWTVTSDAPAIAAAVRLLPSRGYSSSSLS